MNRVSKNILVIYTTWTIEQLFCRNFLMRFVIIWLASIPMTIVSGWFLYCICNLSFACYRNPRKFSEFVWLCAVVHTMQASILIWCSLPFFDSKHFRVFLRLASSIFYLHHILSIHFDRISSMCISSFSMTTLVVISFIKWKKKCLPSSFPCLQTLQLVSILKKGCQMSKIHMSELNKSIDYQ